MNIKILDSWLREYLDTKAKAKDIAEKLSLASVSVERLEKYGKNDFIYDIEVTTNRPDLMSVIGIARETAAVLPQFGIKVQFLPLKLEKLEKPEKNLTIKVDNNPKLVNRINAAVMEVKVGQSPSYIKERLEASGIRSLNNLIDVTNYIMREIGHPVHVFDYDRLSTKNLIVRESKKGEKIITLDGKVHISEGEDIVADNGEGEIVDLLGIMGTQNSVVTDSTKRILLFLDNNDPYHIRHTSMNLGIRTEAAILNEKGIDTELSMQALLRGIGLYKKIADGKLMSEIIDIYPNKPKAKLLRISQKKINNVIGVNIPLKTSLEILNKLGFGVKVQGENITTTVPSWRKGDIEIEEDLIEEIARIYGYHRLPNIIPPLTGAENYNLSKDPFFWEKRLKNALKYWGFTEVYTYSMVSENLLEGPAQETLQLLNPLSEEMIYLRKTLIPSLLQVARENKNREEIKIFELSNIYQPVQNNLPKEVPMLAGVIKKQNISFYKVKGIIQQLLDDLGIKDTKLKLGERGGLSACVYIDKDYLGEIEILDENTADFELSFVIMLKYANMKKAYKELPKFPPVIEDVRITTTPDATYQQIVSLIKNESNFVSDVSLLDTYENKKTFRIKYQDPNKTLTDEEVSKEREKIYGSLEKKLNAKIT